MKILLVEDIGSKAEIVTAVVKSKYPNISFDLVDSVVGAVRALSNGGVDLLILDLFLPINSGGKPMIDGGAGLLREILSRNIPRPRYIVCLTAHKPELVESQEVYNEFSTFVILEYAENSVVWKESLLRHIDHVNDITTDHYPNLGYADFAIVTALADPEFRQVLNVFPELCPHSAPSDPTDYFVGEVTDRGGAVRRLVAAHSFQMGLCAAVSITSKLISKFSPKIVIMTGIAAGVRKNVEIGDVLCATYVFSYESGKRVREKSGEVVFQPSPSPLSCDGPIHEHLNSISGERDYLSKIASSWPGDEINSSARLRLGAIASGAAVIQDSSLVDKLVRSTERKLVGIDMEAYGVAHACSYHHPESPAWLILKGVSDFADEEKDDSAQNFASYVSAAALREIILSGRISELLGPTCSAKRSGNIS